MNRLKFIFLVSILNILPLAAMDETTNSTGEPVIRMHVAQAANEQEETQSKKRKARGKAKPNKRFKNAPAPAPADSSIVNMGTDSPWPSSSLSSSAPIAQDKHMPACATFFNDTELLTHLFRSSVDYTDMHKVARTRRQFSAVADDLEIMNGHCFIEEVNKILAAHKLNDFANLAKMAKEVVWLCNRTRNPTTTLLATKMIYFRLQNPECVFSPQGTLKPLIIQLQKDIAAAEITRKELAERRERLGALPLPQDLLDEMEAVEKKYNDAKAQIKPYLDTIKPYTIVATIVHYLMDKYVPQWPLDLDTDSHALTSAQKNQQAGQFALEIQKNVNSIWLSVYRRLNGATLTTSKKALENRLEADVTPFLNIPFPQPPYTQESFVADKRAIQHVRSHLQLLHMAQKEKIKLNTTEQATLIAANGINNFLEQRQRDLWRALNNTNERKEKIELLLQTAYCLEQKKELCEGDPLKMLDLSRALRNVFFQAFSCDTKSSHARHLLEGAAANAARVISLARKSKELAVSDLAAAAGTNAWLSHFIPCQEKAVDLAQQMLDEFNAKLSATQRFRAIAEQLHVIAKLPESTIQKWCDKVCSNLKRAKETIHTFSSDEKKEFEYLQKMANGLLTSASIRNCKNSGRNFAIACYELVAAYHDRESELNPHKIEPLRMARMAYANLLSVSIHRTMIKKAESHDEKLIATFPTHVQFWDYFRCMETQLYFINDPLTTADAITEHGQKLISYVGEAMRLIDTLKPGDANSVRKWMRRVAPKLTKPEQKPVADKIAELEAVLDTKFPKVATVNKIEQINIE